jgi:hypothetical protein
MGQTLLSRSTTQLISTNPDVSYEVLAFLSVLRLQKDKTMWRHLTGKHSVMA